MNLGISTKQRVNHCNEEHFLSEPGWEKDRKHLKVQAMTSTPARLNWFFDTNYPNFTLRFNLMFHRELIINLSN